MKKSTIYKSMAALIALFMLGSCQNMFNDPLIKNNPNNATDAGVDRVMNIGLVGLAELSEDTDIRIAMMWDGHITGLSRQHKGFAEYIVTTTAFGWANYWNAIANLRIAQNKAKALGLPATQGAGIVAEALLIQKMADLWGAIPYREALQPDAFPNPVYDAMSDVYAQLQVKLDSAVTMLGAGGGVQGDFIYGGVSTPWLEAAHTLKARLALHTGDYATAAAEAASGISSSANDMLIPHGSALFVDQNLHNIFFDINRPGDTGAEAPSVLPDFILAHTTGGTDESRLWGHFFKKGLYNSENLDDPNTEDGMFQVASPVPVMSYLENQLILAEALCRSNAGVHAGALQALNDARAELATGSIYGQTMPAGPSSYPVLVGTDLVTNDQLGLLQEILIQRYIVLFAQLEAYNDLRRCQVATPVVQVSYLSGPNLGTPIASLPIVSTPTGRIPDKYIYPQAQINTNPNVPKPITDQYTKLEIWQ